jgi:hypothetical protein
MDNLFCGKETKAFWIWVDPDNWLVKHHLTTTRQFFSGGLIGNQKSNLRFIPNPEFTGRDVSIFQANVVNNYSVEYNLEINRVQFFSKYPSRLNSLYLFSSEREATEYQKIHPEHVAKRCLVPCHSKSDYLYSEHDLSWIDFLRNALMIDENSINNCANSYWKGLKVSDCSLTSMGKPWSQSPVFEILYIGSIEFYKKDISLILTE